MKKDRLWQCWYQMIYRCYSPKSTNYKIYGARGITVCDEWKHDYNAFKEWALSNGYADNLVCDRIDSKDGYKPDNCRWITKSENSRRAVLERAKRGYGR